MAKSAPAETIYEVWECANKPRGTWFEAIARDPNYMHVQTLAICDTREQAETVLDKTKAHMGLYQGRAEDYAI